MKAAGVIDDLVSIANGRKWEKTKHQQNKDAKYGVYIYNSNFAFPVYNNAGNIVNVRAYDCQLVILNASDGRKYLYDVKEIKENTARANDILLSERQRAAKMAARQGDVSEKTISQSSGNVKKSRRDSAEGLTKEEARAQAAAYTQLKAENAELQRRVEYWKGQTQRTKQATVRQTAPTKMPLPSNGAWRQSRASFPN